MPTLQYIRRWPVYTDDVAGVLLGADTSPGANAPPPSKGDFYRCCGSLDTRGMAHCNKTLLNAKIPYQTSKTGKKKSPFEGGGAKRRGMYAYGPATPIPWTKPSGLYFFSGSPKICAQPGDAIYSRLVRRSEWAGDSPSLASFTSRVYDAFTDGAYTSSPAWTVEARMTYIAFTSPGAEAPPPARGDLSGRSSGGCDARTFSERKSGLGIRRFVSAYYPRHIPQSPPLG